MRWTPPTSSVIPDNYETLSTDAALRAERIACRLRHLIYSSTTIRKGDYLKSASVMHGITITYENEVLAVTLPSLLPKRRQRQSAEFLLDPLYFALGAVRQREHFCLTTGNVLSASPRYMTRRSPQAGA